MESKTSAATVDPTATKPRRRRYQEQDSGLTLAEGLEEYYRANAQRILRPDDLPPESQALFRRHDLCHVIFGLDTSLADETMADTRTLLSCDVGLGRYATYLKTSPEARAIFRELGYGKAILATLKAVPRILAAIGERRRMKKKWPWSPPDDYLGRTLADLRNEFGIRVM